MENKKNKNPLLEFLDHSLLSLHRFSVISGISHNTLYPIYRGVRMPKRPLANRIVKASKGKLKLEDFGYE